jgi:hypothetical protein
VFENGAEIDVVKATYAFAWAKIECLHDIIQENHKTG